VIGIKMYECTRGGVDAGGSASRSWTHRAFLLHVQLHILQRIEVSSHPYMLVRSMSQEIFLDKND
jgi:hypothetical protein